MPAHLAVLQRTYLRLILEGDKSIECRLTRTPKPPFKAVAKGQKIYLKESSGPVLAVAKAKKVICSQINNPEDLAGIRRKYGEGIMAQEEFWQSRADCRYCTLIFLEGVKPLPEPFRISKNDMRGWVVLDGREGFNFPSKKPSGSSE